MLFDLTQKVAIVTGGASGIGESISMRFASQGANVQIIDINEDAGQQLVMHIGAEGGKATFHHCDITVQSEVIALFDQIYQREGSLDILINNAGIAHIGNVETTTEEDFDRVFAVNVKGVYNCLKGAIPHMKAQGKGNIINMASVASELGISERFAYSSSKGAVLTMTYSVAKDYLDYNIRCNSVAPARVHTPFVDGYLARTYPGREEEMYQALSQTQPIGRMGKPDEIANLVLYLASDEAAFITGTNFPIDGGFIKLNT